MAQITWLIDGAQVSEAQIAAMAGTAAGGGAGARFGESLLRPLDDPTIYKPPPPPPPGPGSGQDVWAGIQGTELTQGDMFSMGYVYLHGQWVKVLGVNPDGTTKYEVYSPTGISSASTIDSATTVMTTTPASAGPRPSTLAVIVPFVGGPLQSVRMTTGLGAENGALSPIRMGVRNDLLPRIIMNEVAT